MNIIILSMAIAFICAYLFLSQSVILLLIAFIAGAMFLSVRFPFAFLISLWVLQEKCFKTLDLGILYSYGDAVLLSVLTAATLLQFCMNQHKWRELFKNKYFKYILVILLLVHISIIVGSYFTFHQEIGGLVFRGRAFFSYLLFVYLFLVSFNINQIKKCINFYLVVSVIIAILVIIDAKLLGGQKIFLLTKEDGISGIRVGAARLAVIWFISTWMYFYSLVLIKNTKSVFFRALLLLGVAILLYDFVFVMMFRMQLITLLFMTLIFIYRAGTNIRVVAINLMIVVFLAITILAGMNMLGFKGGHFDNLVNLTQKELNESKGGSIAARINGIRYFSDYYAKSWFWGIGIMSSTDPKSPVVYGLAKGYNFADFGILAALFRFGILSMILFVLLFIDIFRDLKYVSDRHPDGGVRNISESLQYQFLFLLIVPITCTAFFKEGEIFYYAMLIYFVYKMRSDVEPAKSLIK